MIDIQFEVVCKEEPALHAVEVGQQVVDGFLVEFHHLEVDVLTLKKILREDAHSRADFEDLSCVFFRFQCGDYPLRRALIHQEMLA